MWERGLKYKHLKQMFFHLILSFPMWERGLKFSNCIQQFQIELVVPYVGTWIEIYNEDF